MRELLDPVVCSDWLRQTGLEGWAETLPAQLDELVYSREHGDYGRWLEALESLPVHPFADFDLTESRVRLGDESALSETEREALKTSLQLFHPWRKGPFECFGVHIDTEWRSDWKWSRIKPHLAALDGKRVLDVGCGNGYYAWRLLGAGAESVLGLDPTLLFFIQDQAIKRLMAGNDEAAGIARRFLLLPLGIEHLPAELRSFDLVLSMGVLYHRRSPLDHLLELRNALRPGGRLILETLIVEGAEGVSLVPPGRYAKMRNVWFIPSVATLESWLRRLGFREVTTLDVSPTTTDEQRSTDWMRFESLPDFLDPEDAKNTIEGHPAPVRAVVSAMTPT